VAIGVVEGEDAGAVDAGLVEVLEQRAERERAPVLVEAEVGVDVAQLRAVGA